MTGQDASGEVGEEVRAYVAGPMLGSPRFNFDAFESTCDRLRADGYGVTSPHEMDLGRGLDPASPHAGKDVRAALTAQLVAIQNADLVVLLPGWEFSPGSKAAVLVAAAHGVPCVPAADVISALIA